MKITFVRRGGPKESVYVVRDDGSELHFQTWSFGPELPHDLVHAIVESELGIAHGFWGRVNAGADPVRVNEVANRLGGKDKFAGFGEDLRELALAEAATVVGWNDPELDDAARLERLRVAAEAQDLAVAEAWSVATIARTRERLDAVRVEWSALAPNQALSVAFP